MPGGRGKTDDGTGGCREGVEAVENGFCEGDNWFYRFFRDPILFGIGKGTRSMFDSGSLSLEGHPGRIGSFLSLVPVLFQDLFSGLEMSFARQG